MSRICTATPVNKAKTVELTVNDSNTKVIEL